LYSSIYHNCLKYLQKGKKGKVIKVPIEDLRGSDHPLSLADSYLCTDGKPIAGNPLFNGYDSLTNEMKNRDPRFTQTIYNMDIANPRVLDTMQN
jgi:hypothetical protein